MCMSDTVYSADEAARAWHGQGRVVTGSLSADHQADVLSVSVLGISLAARCQSPHPEFVAEVGRPRRIGRDRCRPLDAHGYDDIEFAAAAAVRGAWCVVRESTSS